MKPQSSPPLLRCLLVLMFIVLLADPISRSSAAGRIVVAHDDLILADGGFRDPSDPGKFAQNVAAWFTGGRPGKFLAYSDNQGLTGTKLISAMVAASHIWVVSTTAPLTLSNLLTFDGVFLCGRAIEDANLLRDYVIAGGNVYIGAEGLPSLDMSRWNPFLHQFGLGFADVTTGDRDFPISGSHPILEGVDHLLGVNGTGVLDLEPGNPINRVVARTGSTGLLAVWGLEKAQLLIRTSQVEICWNTETNATYGIQYRSDLTGNQWMQLGTNCFQGDGTIRCIYDIVPLGEAQRYYRLVTNCILQL